MILEIELESKKQRDIISNTLQAYDSVNKMVVGECLRNSKPPTLKVLDKLLSNMKKSEFVDYGGDIDNRALDVGVRNALEKFKEEEPTVNNPASYTTRGKIELFDGNKARIPKLGYVSIVEPLSDDRQGFSDDMHMSIQKIDGKTYLGFDSAEIKPLEEKESVIVDKDWHDLYQYVKTDVMKLDSNDALTSQMVLRLKGMADGKFMANRDVKSSANYTYEQILMTFKFCIMDIRRYSRTKKFKTMQQKFNYIMKIVEGNILNVTARMRYAKQQQESFESGKLKNVRAPNNEGAEYKKKSEEVKNDRLKGYW